ncbi:RING/U-box superfamily protein [Striga asiatica]|uniref:RING-type E3 ubiquitin transferase n=1 Tax=Striga asiatica TaxID=4170 RepID=A0A5A7RF68_STRAF|nr:RING/U-box superfamily protein [Striga asiatica]
MLQIRLSKPASENGATVKPVHVDSVTVACPDHLVLADLPVAKSLGLPCSTAIIKTVGRRSRRQLGERVHFCVRCDFPIAIYGRLSPCEHAFCLDCARSDSLCYLCDERVQKIQTIKMMERIFICAAPHCLKSFLKKSEFESHIRGAHADLLNPNMQKDVNESEGLSARKPLASETTVQAPAKLASSPRSNPQVNDREDKNQRPVMQPNFSSQVLNHPSEQHFESSSNQSHGGADRAATQNRFPQQNFDSQGQEGPRQDSGNQNLIITAAPQFPFPSYASGGGQQFFGAPYGMPMPDSTQDHGPGQNSLLGYPTGPARPITFPSNYPQQWNLGPGTVPLEPPLVTQGPTDGFTNVDFQGRRFFQGDYGPNVGIMPLNVPQSTGNKGVGPMDGKGILAVQPMGLPPPPPLPPPHSANNHDVPPGFGWQD